MQTKKKTGRPRKAAEDKKSVYLRVRIAESHEAEIKEAATRAGIAVSAWAIERLLRCARQEKAAAAK